LFLFRKPTTSFILGFLNIQSRLGFSYQAVGATALIPPAGFTVDHNRFKLGTGEHVFAAAKTVLESWGHFQLGWVEALPRDTPLEVGKVVAVLARTTGLWWLNAARIVYVVDEHGPVQTFGFAYGTLPDHAETGEERFTIAWNRTDDTVWYDILAFSRPHHILARLGYPLVRRLQRQFAQDSGAAMRKGVNDILACFESR
jgi:uncharacterized protein (UPF0548 family)